MEKLAKLEKQEHHWINQAYPGLDILNNIRLHMKWLLDTVEEKTQLLGADMSNIVDLNI